MRASTSPCRSAAGMTTAFPPAAARVYSVELDDAGGAAMPVPVPAVAFPPPSKVSGYGESSSRSG